MKRFVTLGVGILLLAAGPAPATTLFQDSFFWYDDGLVTQFNELTLVSSVVRPAVAPAVPGVAHRILVKIEEDVVMYDPVVDFDVTLGKDRYQYVISNFFDSGNVPYTYVPEWLAPATKVSGTGVNFLSEFDVENVRNIPVTNQGLPPAGWVQGIFGQNIRWDALPPNRGVRTGHDDFFFEVDHGTPHGVQPAWVASHDASGATVNYLTGYVSAPVPEPSSLMLLGGGLLAVGITLQQRRRRAKAR